MSPATGFQTSIRGNAPWLILSQFSGITPARIRVAVDPSALKGGTYSATVETVAGKTTLTDTVNLTVTDAAPDIRTPAVIDLAGVAQSTKPAVSFLHVENAGGGGPQPFGIKVISDSPWLSVSPASGRTNSETALVTVSADLKALQPGVYVGKFRTTAGNVSRDTTVSLLVRGANPLFQLSQRGLRFDTQQGVAVSETQAVSVISGDSGRTSFSAEVTAGQDWLSVTPASGVATQTAPGAITAGISKSLPSGSYYGLVKVTPATTGLPIQYLTVIYNVTTGVPAPSVNPSGLVFTAVQGATAATSQTLNITSRSTSSRHFLLETTVSGPLGWLKIPNASGTASGGRATSLPVAADPTGLSAGTYEGEVAVYFDDDGTVRSVPVLLIVLPPGAKVAAQQRQAAGCTPTRLAVQEMVTGGGGFSTPAGWPVALTVRLLDDCANPITDGSVVISFSNGDPPLSAVLTDGTVASYSATWVASRPASVNVTAIATSPTLAAGSASLLGNVTPSTIPLIAPNGTLHNLNPQIGGSLAPGTVASVYGSGLAAGPDAPGAVPLPVEYKGTSIIIGGVQTPLYFISAGQVNFELPVELAANAQYSIVGMVNGAITVPETVKVAAVAPGVAAFADGRVIAQHVDYSLVDAAHPAHPGDYITIYLAGMGATDPSVPTGNPSPGTEPLGRVRNAPVVMLGERTAQVFFAGLTPGGIGLYQINFQVPADAPSGDLNLVVRQNGVASNVSTLPVRP